MAARNTTGSVRLAPDPAAVAMAAARVRAELTSRGILLYHDARLPSATALAAGEPLAGSWWGHPKGALVYAALSGLGDDVAWPKLVSGKVTLVHRSLWPALAAAALSGAPWQTRDLPRDARSVLAQLDRPTRVDALRTEALPARRVGALLTELERRLLVHAESVHTDSGHHARLLTPWSAWCERVGLTRKSLPSPTDAYATFERAIAGWQGARLPWS